MEATLEKNITTSPLLSDAVIERDYTQGIESQIAGNPAGQQPYQPSEPRPDPSQAQQNQQQQQQFDAGGNFEAPKGFSFEEEIEDPSDTQDGEAAGFELASGSAKTFANVIGDLIKVKVPEITFQFCKIDLNSIEAHIRNGNINSALREVFQQINEGTREALEFSDDEIKMWKKAFKEYLEYKNIKAANPETAFWIATGTLVITQAIKVNELKKQNKKYIYDAINSYNPDYFESFKAKQQEAKEEESAKADKSEI